MSTEITENINWIKSGNIGCVFASALVKYHDKIGWNFYNYIDLAKSVNRLIIPKQTFIISIVFPGLDAVAVKEWALRNGFWVEDIETLYEGLRFACGSFVSWVQYFGPDSHVKTRQTPHAMLSFTVKLPALYHAKVGFNGILHLAHASVENLAKKAQDILWVKSLELTEKRLGYKPTTREGAKTTFVK